MTISAGSRFGSYEVISPLGAGGMGEVYRARDVRLRREVALKVLPEEVSSDAGRLKRFEKEARAASALNHPNIVTIYDIGSSDSVSWIAMERVEGKTLRELLFTGPMPTKRLLATAAQIADGLATAHQSGIVHRDLKPENVMVTREGRAKILDFGLAKLTGIEGASGENASRLPTETGTSPGVVLGTVGYMSPEQAAGQSIDFRSDQFSFGSILYEMATGKRAFQKGTAIDTLSAILHEEPEPLAEISPEAPPPLRWIIERCLAKDPEERYASTRDLARDMAAVRDRGPEMSGATQASEAARSRARLPRVVRAAIAVAALLAAAAAGVLAAASRRPKPSAPSFQRLDFRSGATITTARLTPDGRSVIYGVAGRDGERSVRLHQAWLDSPEIRKFDLPPADILSISSAGEMAIRLTRPPGPDMLARMPLAGGVPRDVVEAVIYQAADWGPDGKTLAIIRSVEGRSRLEYPVGKVLVDNVSGCCLRVSRDGREIAFWEGGGELSSLTVIPASGGERRVLTSNWVGWLSAPVWAPDGREIWFNARKTFGQHQALYAVDRAGRTRLVARVPGDLEIFDVTRDGRVLAGHHTEVNSVMGTAPGESKERDLSWLDGSALADISSDGKKVLIAEMGEGGGPTTATYLRSTDGSPPVRLGDLYPEALSRDGAWVIAGVGWDSAPRKPHFEILPTGPEEKKRPIPNNTLETLWRADWMPDGKRIVIVGHEPGRRSRMWIQDLAGGEPRPITPEGIDVYRYGKFASPDGTFVLGYKDKGEAVLYPTAGGDPKSISGWKEGDVVIQWSADGKTLFVCQIGENPRKIFLLDLATGQRRFWKEIRTTDPQGSGIARLFITPDGSAYAYSQSYYTSHLYVINGLR